MTKFEFVTRCQRHFAKRTNDYAYDWSENAELCYESAVEFYGEIIPDYPEYYADEEMDCWD